MARRTCAHSHSRNKKATQCKSSDSQRTGREMPECLGLAQWHMAAQGRTNNKTPLMVDTKTDMGHAHRTSLNCLTFIFVSVFFILQETSVPTKPLLILMHMNIPVQDMLANNIYSPKTRMNLSYSLYLYQIQSYFFNCHTSIPKRTAGVCFYVIRRIDIAHLGLGHLRSGIAILGKYISEIALASYHRKSLMTSFEVCITEQNSALI